MRCLRRSRTGGPSTSPVHIPRWSDRSEMSGCGPRWAPSATGSFFRRRPSKAVHNRPLRRSASGARRLWCRRRAAIARPAGLLPWRRTAARPRFIPAASWWSVAARLATPDHTPGHRLAGAHRAGAYSKVGDVAPERPAIASAEQSRAHKLSGDPPAPPPSRDSPARTCRVVGAALARIR